jgi:hypothetical protein
MTKLISSRSMLALLALAASAGCGSQATEAVDQASQALSEDGQTAIDANEQSSNALTDAAFDTAAVTDPSAAADALVAASSLPVDAKCRTRAKDPSDPHTVIITLTDCTGRFGKRHVSGTEIVRFTQGAAGVLHADFHSVDLTVDGRPANHTASADITFAAGQRHVAWQGAWDTVNAAGLAVSHTSNLSIDVDTATRCRTRDGAAVTLIGDAREIDTTITALTVCRDADGDPSCPIGTVVHANKANGKTVTVAFDGSAEASITTPKGVTIERPLTCQP